MKVYIATLVDLENTVVIGAYSTEDLAIGKVEKAMDEMYFNNEDYGVFPMIVEKHIDDMTEEDYT